MNTNRENRSIITRPSTNVLSTDRQQQKLEDRQVRTLEKTFDSIWLDSDEMRIKRESTSNSLAAIQNLAGSGQTIVSQIQQSVIRDIHNNLDRLEESKNFQNDITKFAFQRLSANLDRHLQSPEMNYGSADVSDRAMSLHQNRQDAISGAVASMRDELTIEHADCFKFAETSRKNSAANAILFFDMAERNLSIHQAALHLASDEYKKECVLKFQTIDKAITFVATVQQAMQKHAEQMDIQLDRESARRMTESQQTAAEAEAMKKLNMSQMEATRAADILDKKDNYAFSIKREELLMQKCKDRQEHERRSKRYFSIWGFLFG